MENIANLEQQWRNRRRYHNATTRNIGVYPRGNKWRAILRRNGKNIHLGSFESEQAAVNARINADKGMVLNYV